MNQKRNTIILTAVLLAAALGGILVQRLFFHADGAYARVLLHGKEIARLSLEKDIVFTAGDKQEGYNRIEVSHGTVAVTEADCPDQICVREGAQKNSGAVIACLPHELIVIVEASGSRAPDAVAW